MLHESLKTNELWVYAQVNDAHIYHYSDSNGLEIDSIVQKRNGDWAAFEIKLGKSMVTEAASNLKKNTNTVIDYMGDLNDNKN